jgi:DNA-binding NarL/FixJ family response regulator
MPSIRILLAEAAAGLQTMVHNALAGRPDLVVIGDASDEVDVLLQAAGADVVIIGMSSTTLPSVAERLLEEYPRLGVLAIDVDRERGLLYQLRPQLTEFVQLTPAILAAAIRRAASDLAA